MVYLRPILAVILLIPYVLCSPVDTKGVKRDEEHTYEPNYNPPNGCVPFNQAQGEAESSNSTAVDASIKAAMTKRGAEDIWSGVSMLLKKRDSIMVPTNRNRIVQSLVSDASSATMDMRLGCPAIAVIP